MTEWDNGHQCMFTTLTLTVLRNFQAFSLMCANFDSGKAPPSLTGNMSWENAENHEFGLTWYSYCSNMMNLLLSNWNVSYSVCSMQLVSNDWSPIIGLGFIINHEQKPNNDSLLSMNKSQKLIHYQHHHDEHSSATTPESSLLYTIDLF